MIDEALVSDKLSGFFGPEGSSGFGIVCRQSVTNAFAAKEAARIAGIEQAVLKKDLRGAPFFESGAERAFLSISDEDGIHCAAAYRADCDDRTAGIGIDLASVREFRGGKIQFAMEKRFFSEGEKDYAESFPGDEQALRCAVLFSAKEAAIKATADLIRHFEQGEKISERFGIGDFEIGFSDEHGKASPKGEAKAVSEKLGISEIEVVYILFEDYVFTAAKALKE